MKKVVFAVLLSATLQFSTLQASNDQDDTESSLRVPGSEFGKLENDTILEIDGRPVIDSFEASEQFRKRGNQIKEITVLRKGKHLILKRNSKRDSEIENRMESISRFEKEEQKRKKLLKESSTPLDENIQNKNSIPLNQQETERALKAYEVLPK